MIADLRDNESIARVNRVPEQNARKKGKKSFGIADHHSEGFYSHRHHQGQLLPQSVYDNNLPCLFPFVVVNIQLLTGATRKLEHWLVTST